MERGCWDDGGGRELDFTVIALILVCEETGVVLRGGLREAVLVCGVLILGDTYDRGEEASDVRDIGDWLDCWATWLDN